MKPKNPFSHDSERLFIFQQRQSMKFAHSGDETYPQVLKDHAIREAKWIKDHSMEFMETGSLHAFGNAGFRFGLNAMTFFETTPLTFAGKNLGVQVEPFFVRNNSPSGKNLLLVAKPTKEEATKQGEKLGVLGKTTLGDFWPHELIGGIGAISVSFNYLWTETGWRKCALIESVQPRKVIFRSALNPRSLPGLPAGLRDKYGKWHHAVFQVLEERLRRAGVKFIAMLSDELKQRVPKEMRKRYYVSFPAKNGFNSEAQEVEMLTISGITPIVRTKARIKKI